MGPMIYTRRTIQLCLNELDWLPRRDLRKIVAKLNDPSPGRLPTMWEVFILGALSQLGTVEYERQYPNGKQPDITFDGDGLTFAADVTCISDRGLDEANPVQELVAAIEESKERLGLPAGGQTLRIEGARHRKPGDARMSLFLPPREQIREFVRERVEPVFRAQLEAGQKVLECVIKEQEVWFGVKVEGERYNRLSYPSFDLPASVTENLLYRALDKKAQDLAAIDGTKGIIVCDGDSQAMRPRTPQSDPSFSERKVMTEFLRRNPAIDFALTISVKEVRPHSHTRSPKQLVVNLVGQPELSQPEALDELFRTMAELMPEPAELPVNAALRAREPGFGWGKHGGYTMSRNSLSMSSRLLVEVLAGRRSCEELNRLQRWRSADEPADNERFLNPFERWLSEGRLPVSIAVEQEPEGTDDTITFKFGDPDAAVSPFRVPPARKAP